MNMNVRDWTDPIARGAVSIPRRLFGCVTKNNTTMRQEDSWTIVRLHETDIVRFNDDVIVLNTGGWFSVTTKARMNQVAERFVLSFRVYSEDGGWVVCHNPESGGHVFEPGSVVYDFHGDRLDIDRNEYI